MPTQMCHVFVWMVHLPYSDGRTELHTHHTQFRCRSKTGFDRYKSQRVLGSMSHSLHAQDPVHMAWHPCNDSPACFWSCSVNNLLCLAIRPTKASSVAYISQPGYDYSGDIHPPHSSHPRYFGAGNKNMWAPLCHKDRQPINFVVESGNFWLNHDRKIEEPCSTSFRSVLENSKRKKNIGWNPRNLW